MRNILVYSMIGALALAFLFGEIVLTNAEQEALNCQRAGVALCKSSAYSVFSGCYLDGAPREIVLETP